MFSLLYCKKAIKICATLQALSLLNQPLYYYPGSLRIYPFCQQARTAPTGRSILRAGLSTHAILLSDFIAGCPVQGSEGVCLQARTKQAIRQPARSAGCHPAKTNTTHAVAHRQPHSPHGARSMWGKKRFEKCCLSISGRNQREDAWKAQPLYFPELKL